MDVTHHGPGAPESRLDNLEALFLGQDADRILHVLRTAALAAGDGARPALVAAALLHDRDAEALAGWFGPDVTEPVRLHAAARRYLCRAEPGYLDRLSAASARALALEGGPMTVAQARAYEAEPYARDAVTLRRWDERAKGPGTPVPSFAHYRPLLAALLTSA